VTFGQSINMIEIIFLISQHQHQITSRIEQFLSSKNFNEKNKQSLLIDNHQFEFINFPIVEILNQIESLCSLQSFDIDLSIFEKKIAEKQYQRCKCFSFCKYPNV
jgi:hypothetical protein